MKLGKCIFKMVILITIFILLAFGGYSAFAQNAKKKCGDGICDGDEQMDPNLCPRDCTPSTRSKPEPGRFNVAKLPFAFGMGVPPNEINKNLNEAVEMGLEWVRLAGPTGIVWDQIERTPGKYDWRMSDKVISTTYRTGIKIFMTVLVVNKAHQVAYGYAPADMEAYTTFLSKAVERYDGDGFNDAPGAPVVNVWQIGNEIDNPLWKDSLKHYASLLKASYKAVKSANPDAKVAIAGMLGPTGMRKYAEVLSFLRGDIYLDIFDIHWHAIAGGNYRNQKGPRGRTENFDEYISGVRRVLNDTGYTHVEIWITEMSASHDKPVGKTEKTQAIELIKRYLYPVSSGVSVIFWGIHDMCWMADCSHYFASTGLITQTGHKKLAYFTYRLMVAMLEKMDWNTLEIVQESDHVYIYKLTKKDTKTSTWIAWRDYFDDTGASKTVTLPVGNIKSVKIIEAVPNVASGAEINKKEYLNFFTTETQQVRNGEIILTLQERPIFIVMQ